MRQLFGQELELGPRLLAWGREQAKREQNLSSISQANDFPAKELRLWEVNRPLAESLWPHQRADAKFMASTSCINANEQGTGKTRAVVAAAYEAGLEQRPHLVVTHMVAPIEATWAVELEQTLPPGIPILASEDPKERERMIRRARELYELGEPFWLILNKEMVRYIAEYEEVFNTNTNKYRKVEVATRPAFPELFSIKWGTVTIDEFHKVGLSNEKTLGARAFRDLIGDLRYAMSGTPMQGKPMKLWGALHWLDPKAFPAKWTWYETWLVIEEDYMGHKHVKGIRPGLEDAFYAHLAPYMVRRLKSEVFPELPPKEYEDVWCRMTPSQARQYNAFAEDAEVRIDEYQLTASNILAEYQRLMTFATARCEVEGRIVYDYRTRENIEKLKLISTQDSGKFPRLHEKLQEVGVEPDEDQLGALVGAHDRSIVEAAAAYLRDKGYRVAVLHGGMKKEDGTTREIVKAFQDAGPEAPQIICMTISKGGTSLTADRADSVHILEENWVPDDQEQFEDRAHRGSRMHRVRVFYYRTRGTIEEYKQEVTTEKALVNYDILDLRRQGFKAIKKGVE